MSILGKRLPFFGACRVASLGSFLRREIVTAGNLRLLIAALTTGPFVFATDADAASINSDLLSLLNETANVQYIKVALPGSMFQIDGVTAKRDVYLEGVIQQNTCWIKNCDESPAGSGPVRPGCVCGASFREDWTLRKDGYWAVSPKVGKTKEPPDQLLEQSLLLVRKSFGLGAIQPGSLQLNSDNSFTAVSMWRGRKISGVFTVGDDSKLIECNYRLATIPGNWCARYSYDGSNAKIPSRVLTTYREGADSFPVQEYQIMKCILGAVDVPASGFTPDYLKALMKISPTNLWLSNQKYKGAHVLFSNSAAYFVPEHGRATVMRPPNLLRSRGLEEWRLFIPVAFMLSFGMIMALLKFRSNPALPT